MNAACDVLVVDDEPVVRDAVRRVLGEEGLAVVGVPDAERALAHPGFADCRLVVCDLMLPGGSGLDALRAMRARRPELPIIIITGYGTPDHADRVLAAGASAFLPKPFDQSELSTLVRRALRPFGAPGEESRP